MGLQQHGGYLSEQGYRDLKTAIRNFPSIKVLGKPKRASGNTICVKLSGDENDFRKLFSSSVFFEEPNDT